ncbi:hypothetical protein [Microbacterium sp. Ag1]|uniref:hypothetical protein n=1 Tax=Microbacterium sp. Ag1 TaxID=1643443 RepID=UPI00062976AF|nr:hypothetical protein [Microbacterium sp. Ag1]KKX96702.1 hypothetical protein AAY78_15400 [Microbacterium sp. Ag1]
MSTHRTFPIETRTPNISPASFLFMRAEIERLKRELAAAERELFAVRVDRDHWYMRANYTPEQIAEMYHRASQGLDENGAWLWPDSVRTTR